VRTASFLGDFFLVPLSRVSILLFSVEILCVQLGLRHHSEIPISSLVSLVRCPSFGFLCHVVILFHNSNVTFSFTFLH
jgi:hypothetical protein